MLKLLEEKFGELVAKKVFLFLRHPAADLVDELVRQYKTCTREWSYYARRTSLAPPPFQMSYFFAYSLSKVFERRVEISVASLKMMYRHAFVALKGRTGRRYWYCLYEDRYEVARYEEIQTGYHIIRFDTYDREDSDMPFGYVSCVDPGAEPPPAWAINLDGPIRPYVFL